jgi:hypothetical protein
VELAPKVIARLLETAEGNAVLVHHGKKTTFTISQHLEAGFNSLQIEVKSVSSS